MCCRLLEKIEKLKERQGILLGRGEQNSAEAMNYEIDRYERWLELAEMKRDHPERMLSDTSRNHVLERMQRPTEYTCEQRNLWWQSELE